MLRDAVAGVVVVPEIFRHAVEQIMRQEAGRDLIMGERPEEPRSHGWLRRSDLDGDGHEAWELPDGTIRLTAPACPVATPRQASPTRSGA